MDTAPSLMGGFFLAGFVPAYCLQEILALLEANARSPDPANLTKALLYALLTFAAHISFAQLDLFHGWHTRRCYERTRGQLFCAIHYKALQRKDTRGKVGSSDETEAATGNVSDIGRVVNLMSGDAYAVSQRFWEFSSVFTSPIKLTIALVFLYQ